MLNLKFAIRTLFKTPFVTTVAIASLALGIGANAAIFSLFNQILLRPLPVPEPDRLVNIGAPGPKPGSNSSGQQGDNQWVFSYPLFRDLEKVQTSFTGLAAHVSFGANLAARGQTESVDGLLVSGNYFPVVGIRPAIGRLLTPEDDRAPGESHVAVLSWGYWQRRFGLDPSILGQSITVNGQPMTVVGVTERGFDSTSLGLKPAIFAPITMRGFSQPFKGFDNRRSVLGVRVRAAEGRNDDRSGARRSGCAVPQHPPRGGSAAAARDERPDDGEVQGQDAADGTRRAWPK